MPNALKAFIARIVCTKFYWEHIADLYQKEGSEDGILYFSAKDESYTEKELLAFQSAMTAGNFTDFTICPLPASMMATEEQQLCKMPKSPFDNNIFRHAEDAFQAMQMITEENYIGDFASEAIIILEQFYEGFLTAALEFDDTYQLSDDSLLCHKHDIWGLYHEIKKNYTDCFPRQTRYENLRLKQKMNRWSKLCESALYTEYLPFWEFRQIMDFVAIQRNTIQTYILETDFKQGYGPMPWPVDEENFDEEEFYGEEELE